MTDEKDSAAETGSPGGEVEAGEVSETEIEQLRGQLGKKEAEAKENYERFLRSAAEFENFKKRAQREKEDYQKYSLEKIVREILPVLDNLERAVEHSKSANDYNKLVEGVEMTARQFFQCLEKFGVRHISALGEKFDPALHEAIMQVDEGDYDSDTVVSEHQKGYTIADRLLRPCLVTVAKARKKLEE